MTGGCIGTRCRPDHVVATLQRGYPHPVAALEPEAKAWPLPVAALETRIRGAKAWPSLAAVLTTLSLRSNAATSIP